MDCWNKALPLVAVAEGLSDKTAMEFDDTVWASAAAAVYTLIGLDNSFIRRQGVYMASYAELISNVVAHLQLSDYGLGLPCVNPLPPCPDNAYTLLKLSAVALRFPISRKLAENTYEELLKNDLTGLKTKLSGVLRDISLNIPDSVDTNPILMFLFARSRAGRAKLTFGATLSELKPRVSFVREMHDCLSRCINELAVVYSVCLSDCLRVEYLRRFPVGNPAIARPGVSVFTSEICKLFYPSDAVGEQDTAACIAAWLKWLYEMDPDDGDTPEPVDAAGLADAADAEDSKETEKVRLENVLTVSDYVRCIISAIRLTDISIQCWWARSWSGGAEVVAVWQAIIAQNIGVRIWPVVVWRAIWLMAVQRARTPEESGDAAVPEGQALATQAEAAAHSADDPGAVAHAMAEQEAVGAGAADDAKEPDAGNDGQVEVHQPVLLTLNDALGFLGACDMQDANSAQMGVFGHRCRDLSALFPAGWVSPGRNWWHAFVGTLMTSSSGAVAISHVFKDNCKNLKEIFTDLPFVTTHIMMPLEYVSKAIPAAYVSKWDSKFEALFPVTVLPEKEAATARDTLAHSGFPWTSTAAVSDFLDLSVLTAYPPGDLCTAAGGSDRIESKDFYKMIGTVLMRWRDKTKNKDSSQRDAKKDLKLSAAPWPWSANKTAKSAESTRLRMKRYRENKKTKSKKKSATDSRDESYSLPAKSCPATRRSLPARRSRGQSLSPQQLDFDVGGVESVEEAVLHSDEDVDDFSVYNVLGPSVARLRIHTALVRCVENMETRHVTDARMALHAELRECAADERLHKLMELWCWACQRWPRQGELRNNVCSQTFRFWIRVDFRFLFVIAQKAIFFKCFRFWIRVKF